VLTWDDYVRYVATLPHEPLWNLVPRQEQACPWTCTWHGEVGEATCGECRREHAEYRGTGTWQVKDGSEEMNGTPPDPI